MKNAVNMKVLGVVALLGTGLLLTGCKPAPDLTETSALAMIQAKYDQMPAAGVNITVDDLGMRQGIAAKYWERTKVYPNKFWADFTLTPEGKKALSLPKGGDVIQWRPDSLSDTHFSVVVVTVAANHMKAHDIKELQDEVGGSKSTTFTLSENLDGVPSALQNIAHNPGNKLSSKHTATFVLDGGAWKLQLIT